MSIIDSVDEQIVRLLGQNARQSSETLAKQLNLSAATVRRRFKKLIRSDLIRIVGVVDPASFGFPVAIVIGLNVAADKLESNAEALANRPEIIWVSATTGQFDIIALAQFSSTKSLSEFLTKELGRMEGVRDFEAFTCFGVKKGDRTPLTELS